MCAGAILPTSCAGWGPSHPSRRTPYLPQAPDRPNLGMTISPETGPSGTVGCHPAPDPVDISSIPTVVISGGDAAPYSHRLILPIRSDCGEQGIEDARRPTRPDWRGSLGTIADHIKHAHPDSEFSRTVCRHDGARPGNMSSTEHSGGHGRTAVPFARVGTAPLVHVVCRQRC